MQNQKFLNALPSASLPNVAFVSSENTDSTNNVNTAYVGSTTSGNNLQKEFPSSSSLLTDQSSCPQLDHEDLEQLNEFDLEEMDLKWQVAMISIRLKKFNNKSGRKIHFDSKEPVGFDKTKVECYNCHKTGYFVRECRSKRSQDFKRKDVWNSRYKAKDNKRKPGKQEASNALVTSNAFDDKNNLLTYHKKLLDEAKKEKKELSAKVKSWQKSSEGLKILLNSQMSAKDKTGLGYGNHSHTGILSYENEMFESVFDTRSSDLEDTPENDRYAEGMHVVPPPMTGIYIPSGPEKEIGESQFSYDPKQSQTSESETHTSDFDTCESNTSVETPKTMPETVVNKTNVESQPKVWTDAPIIEEYEETVKDQFTHSKSHRVDKKGLGYGFSTKACFVCGSLSHLIRDCDFHEKRMATQAELNKRVCKGTGLRENRPVWNNVQRVNHQNQFVPQAVLTRNVGSQAVVKTAKGNKGNAVNSLACWSWDYKLNEFTYRSENNSGSCSYKTFKFDDPHKAMKNKGIVDSGCSRHMTGNKAYLVDYQDYNGGPVAFGGSKGYITGKGKIKTKKLDFKDVSFVKELQQFNLFSVSQMCDKKNMVLFTNTEGLVLSPDFKLPDENQVLLRATVDESNMWHRRLGHVNFKNLNKLVKGNLVRGLPSKVFQNDHTCVACQKGKQNKASCKAKSVSSISQPLQLLHMDLFGPTSVRSINHKTYCLVITDDFSRFSWVFFLRTKDETSAILKDFIRQVENQLNNKVKTIRCDNGTKFKNRDIIEFCRSKGIKREYSNARTPQQNGVAKRKNKTLIEAARTMLQIHFYLTPFGQKQLLLLAIYIRPFGYHVTILNTLNHLGKFEGKADEGKGPTWLFDLDYLTDSMNYQPVRLVNQADKPAGPKETNHSVGTQVNTDARNSDLEDEPVQEYCVLPSWSSYTSTIKSSRTKNGNDKSREDTGMKSKEKPVNMEEQVVQSTEDLLHQNEDARASGTKTVNTASTPVSTASPLRDLSTDESSSPVSLNYADQDDSQIPPLEDIYDNPNERGLKPSGSFWLLLLIWDS
ncbi:putative ribonuclease H-like domain-containing protein [Tanacetum coccineum]